MMMIIIVVIIWLIAFHATGDGRRSSSCSSVVPVRRRSCNLELLSFPFSVSSSFPLCLPCVAASTTHATDVQAP